MSFSDIAASGIASFLVSPIITAVDKSVMANASGKTKLVPCLKETLNLATRCPFSFLASREFKLVWGVYWATYASANVTDTICKEHQVSPSFPVFGIATLVNLTASLWKDKEYARMFGLVASRSQMPKATYFFFALRDSLTILAAFTMVPKVAAHLEEQEMSLPGLKPMTSAQLLCPMSVQFVSTPLHLLGLDFYNRPAFHFHELSLASRSRFIGREYMKCVTARTARILPAFGIGGIGNSYFRTRIDGRVREF